MRAPLDKGGPGAMGVGGQACGGSINAVTRRDGSQARGAKRISQSQNLDLSLSGGVHFWRHFFS